MKKTLGFLFLVFVSGVVSPMNECPSDLSDGEGRYASGLDADYSFVCEDDFLGDFFGDVVCLPFFEMEPTPPPRSESAAPPIPPSCPFGPDSTGLPVAGLERLWHLQGGLAVSQAAPFVRPKTVPPLFAPQAAPIVRSKTAPPASVGSRESSPEIGFTSPWQRRSKRPRSKVMHFGNGGKCPEPGCTKAPYKSGAGLRRHMLDHEHGQWWKIEDHWRPHKVGPRLYRCPKCKRLGNWSWMSGHVNLCDGNGIPCASCEARFRTRSDWRQHILDAEHDRWESIRDKWQRYRKAPRLYECDQCLKRGSRSWIRGHYNQCDGEDDGSSDEDDTFYLLS